MLLRCAECRGPVSAAATACPKCGHPVALTLEARTQRAAQAMPQPDWPPAGGTAVRCFNAGVILMGMAATIVAMNMFSGVFFKFIAPHLRLSGSVSFTEIGAAITLTFWALCFVNCRLVIRHYRRIGIRRDWRAFFVASLFAQPCALFSVWSFNTWLKGL